MKAGYLTDEEREEIAKAPITATGVTRWNRSESGRECMCCDGGHVYGYSITLDNALPHPYNDLQSWCFNAIRSVPEGSKVKFTMEVIDE
jgi:hypothetical protein